MADFKGKTMVITGACRGIGKGITEYFAKRGANMVIASNAELIFDTAKSLQASYPDIVLYPKQVDVTDESQVSDLFSFTQDKFGHIDIAVLNAGIITIETFDAMPAMISAKCWT